MSKYTKFKVYKPFVVEPFGTFFVGSTIHLNEDKTAYVITKKKERISIESTDTAQRAIEIAKSNRKFARHMRAPLSNTLRIRKSIQAIKNKRLVLTFGKRRWFCYNITISKLYQGTTDAQDGCVIEMHYENQLIGCIMIDEKGKITYTVHNPAMRIPTPARKFHK
jgi:hypothetical protein